MTRLVRFRRGEDGWYFHNDPRLFIASPEFPPITGFNIAENVVMVSTVYGWCGILDGGPKIMEMDEGLPDWLLDNVALDPE